MIFHILSSLCYPIFSMALSIEYHGYDLSPYFIKAPRLGYHKDKTILAIVQALVRYIGDCVTNFNEWGHLQFHPIVPFLGTYCH